MENILKYLLFILNKPNIKKYFGWVINLIILNYAVVLFIKKEHDSFHNAYFHAKKQSQHPQVGERTIEYLWVLKRIGDYKGKRILDVGSKVGLPITDIMIEENQVVGLDLNIGFDDKHENLSLIKGDIRKTNFGDNYFDCVVIVSTLEHVGIAGRYGITEMDDCGDFKAMKEIYRILKNEGTVIGTVPFGTGRSLPLNRLYNIQRLREVFSDFDVLEITFFRFYEKYNLWREVEEAVAFENNWDQDPWYSLACFYLKKH